MESSHKRLEKMFFDAINSYEWIGEQKNISGNICLKQIDRYEEIECRKIWSKIDW